MTETEMQNKIYCRFFRGNKLIAMACSTLLSWESDLLIVTRALYLHEFEIKLTRSDFLADKKKEKHTHIQEYLKGEKVYDKKYGCSMYQCRVQRPASYFWYVCMNGLIKPEEVPEYAGLIDFKDDIFKEQVEMYYTRVQNEGITTSIANEILLKFKEQDIAYQILAYKMISLVKLMGGQVSSDGTIEDFGRLTDKYLETGKMAYLTAIQTQQYSILKGE